MESIAAREAVEALEASAAALVVHVRRAISTLGSTGADPLREQAEACLDGIEETARVEAMLAAVRVHLTAAFADKSMAMAAPARGPGEHTAQEMGVVSEVACVLTVSERAAGALLAQSHELTTALHLTLAALQAGSISWLHARAMVDETANLDPAGAAALEAHFLDPNAENPARGCPAGELVPSRFRHKARIWRERHHPDSIEKRHGTCALDRRLDYTPDRDGMAWLGAYLPADQAAGIWDRTTAAARALQGPTEDRTLTQLRADTAAAWLLGGTADEVPSLAAQVLVTVPVFALMGLTDEAGMLDGYGPIPASMARRLVADGAPSFRRVLTDPRDGAPLEIGRASYRIPPAMRQWLRLRDGKCPFPGCSNQSLDNEADHILAWADGGTTGISNLGQPCPKHHRLKHSTAWTPAGAESDKPPGWTSPNGRYYQGEHQDWEPPRWPPQILEELSHQEPGSVLPADAQSEGALPGCLLPADRSRDWAWLRQAPEEPEPYLSVADFFWLSEQPLRNRASH